MSLLVYLPRKFDQTHEREQFRDVCKLLKARYYSRQDELCIFVANYNIGNVELDGFLIKNDGIATLEFKDYGGKIVLQENGDWKGESPDGHSFIVKGGAGRKNPYAQAKINRSAFKAALPETGALTDEQVKNTSSIILFHQPCEFDNKVSPSIRWFKTVDQRGFTDCFDDIVSSGLDLEEKDFYKIIDRLNLDEDWLVLQCSNHEVLDRKADYDATPEEAEIEINLDDLLKSPEEDTEPEPIPPVEITQTNKPDSPVDEENMPGSHCVRLPDWVDTLLYDKLKAKYEPDWKRFSENLDLNEDEQKTYLGTYFPRSYAELYCIVKSMMQNDRFQSTYEKLDEIAIFDLCSGCGGDLVGVITALAESLPNLKSLLVMVVEACESSITSLKTIIAETRKHFPKIKIDCKCARCVISDFSELEKLNIREFVPYDFLLFNKAGGEIIRQGEKDAYYKACGILSSMMNMTGVTCILDVTTKDPGENTFYPQIMNRQVNKFISESKTFETILPLSCRYYEHTCKKPCFMQQNFYVSHRFKMKDFSKVAYRIIGHRLFVTDATLNQSPNGKAYQANANAQENTPCSTGLITTDAFKLKEQ